VRRLVGVALILVAGVAGFLLGRATQGSGGRAGSGGGFEGGERASPYRVNLPVEDVVEQQRRVARIEALEAENAVLRQRLEDASVAAVEGELRPGARRPDGTIVGGARWGTGFVQVATSFVEEFFSNFIREAQLTPEQERRVREGVRFRIGEAMQVTAEYVNGDIDGDAAYERMAQLVGDGRSMVRELLDERQIAIYERHEESMTKWMNDQVISKEMTALRGAVGLDSEQEKRVRAVIEQRWARVSASITTAIPNVLVTPIRREQDRAIYEETAVQIRQLLRPEQQAAYEKADQAAATAVFDYRNMLVPK
jgi:hypothetical protein